MEEIRMKKTFFSTVIITLWVMSGLAQERSVPLLLNYQGYLTTAADTMPVTGQANLTFSLYSSATGGSPLWSETHNNVNVAKGFFNVLLGDINPLSASLFDGSTRYLEVSANSQTFSPRKPLVSVCYAIKSQRADTALYASAAGSAPVSSHSHIGERWSTSSGTLGLSLKVEGNTNTSVYGYVDTVMNTGSGTTSGMALNVYGSGTGLRRGVYALADNGGSGAAYGGVFETSNSSFGTGERIGVRAFAARTYDGQPLYGVYALCWPGTAHNGQAYGGYFNVEGGSSNATKYGIYATATGSGTNYAGYFAGNLLTTGKLTFASTYVPASASDPNGNVGDIAYDANYIYIKTASGWRRAALSIW